MTSTQETVLVTGASRGIGRAIAERLASDGLRVVGVARTEPDTFPGTFRPVDLAAADAKARLAAIAAEFRPTRLVANAGIADAAMVADVTDESFEAVQRMNVQSVLWSMQAVIPAMKTAGFGRMVLIGSRAALGKKQRAAYSTSKAALSGLTKTAALELGGHGITVNIVAPGPIETEMFANLQPEGSPERAVIVGKTAVGRVGRPDEIAAAVAYFLSADAGFTTGQTLYVCGGMTVGGSS